MWHLVLVLLFCSVVAIGLVLFSIVYCIRESHVLVNSILLDNPLNLTYWLN